MTEQSAVSHAQAHEDYSQPDGLLKTSHPLSRQLKSDVTSSHTNSCTHARSQLKHTGSSKTQREADKERETKCK